MKVLKNRFRIGFRAYLFGQFLKIINAGRLMLRTEIFETSLNP